MGVHSGLECVPVRNGRTVGVRVDSDPFAREDASLRARAAEAVRAQAKQPGWLNAHGLRHDFYVEKLHAGPAAELIDRPGWGGVESEVLTHRREAFEPPPPPDLGEILTDDKNAFKPGYRGTPAGPLVPRLSRASQRMKQEEEAQERARQMEETRIAAGGPSGRAMALTRPSFPLSVCLYASSRLFLL